VASTLKAKILSVTLPLLLQNTRSHGSSQGLDNLLLFGIALDNACFNTFDTFAAALITAYLDTISATKTFVLGIFITECCVRLRATLMYLQDMYFLQYIHTENI
jgi:hypothetical protein